MPKVRLIANVFNMKLASVWLKDRHTGEILDIPIMEDCETLIRLNMAEPISDIPKLPNQVEGDTPSEAKVPKEIKEEAPKEIDSRFIAWLEQHGFARAPNGVAFSKTVKLETGKVVKLTVDFKDNSHGNRYGLSLNEDTGGWKTDEAMRDHPDLLEFKRYRDDLLAQNTSKPEITKEGNPEKVIPGGEGQGLVLEMEKRDEDQILAELSGDFASEILKDYFYSFKRGDRTIIGLSYKGVKQIILRHGKVELKDIEIRETDRAFIVIVKAWDKVRDITAYGVAYEEKSMPLALQRATSKAQRNALKFLIPESMITEAYRNWQEKREL